MDKSLVKNIFGFLAISFPGFFRVYLVFIVSILCSEHESNIFSNLYLYVAFLSSVIGMPLAAMAIERGIFVDYNRAFVFVIIHSFLSSLALYLVYPSINLYYATIIFSATLLSSLYELMRQNLLNKKSYSVILVNSIISIVMLSVFAHMFSSFGAFVCLFSFFILLLPTLFSVMKNNELTILNNSLFIQKYYSYSFSTLLSTSVNFFLPIAVLNFIGNSFASEVAQVFSIVSIFLMLPRVWSNSFILKLRESLDNINLFNVFFIKVFLYVCCSSALIFLYASFYHDNSLIYALLGFSTFLSQLSLPYSCVFSVLGRPSLILKVNVVSISIVIFPIILLPFFGVIELTALIFLVFVIVYQCLKFAMSHYYYRKIKI